MSILCISKVWAYSRAQNATLLVLLAVADFADDEGIAYPSVETLAQKARIDRRTAQRALADLEQMGELSISLQAGMRGCNLYRINLGSTTTQPQSNAPAQQAQTGGGKNDIAGGNTPQGDKLTGGGKNDARGRHLRQEGAAKTTRGGGVMPPEPSENHQRTVNEPSYPREEDSPGPVAKPSAKMPRPIQPDLPGTPPKAHASMPELPPATGPELRQAWEDWLQHRKESRKPLTPTAARALLAQIAKWTEPQAVANIQHAIQAGWQGVFDRQASGSSRARHRGRTTPADGRFSNAF